MRCFIPLLLLLLSPSLLGAAELKAGAFAQDVTPEKFPVSVNGGMADRKAAGSCLRELTESFW